MSTIKRIILTEVIRDKIPCISNVEGACAPQGFADVVDENAVTVDIKINYDYSPKLIKEALTKIFETAMKCW